ncbi:alpha/beta hydrolase [Novosphingobium sp. RD2P27]|uniref:Alpha/beta hydrolase n=1 Tax=Novosphingobium kalidii TaxID=3230299 RepID=A0ABV2D302_9SPHN
MSARVTSEMINPELRDALAKVPRVPLKSALFRRIAPYLMKLRPAPELPEVSVSVRRSNRLYRPNRVRTRGALLWIHGGGYIIGSAAIDDALCGQIARELGIQVVSAEYRLAPRHRYPAALDDCHEVWRWMLREADALGIDRHHIALGGMSAGGGLAAALVHRLRDEGGLQRVAQLLMAPMLHDLTAARRELDEIAHPMWGNDLNRFGWRSYLGYEPGASTLPDYASPARCGDLSNLPPTWIGVTSIELFREEESLTQNGWKRRGFRSLWKWCQAPRTASRHGDGTPCSAVHTWPKLFDGSETSWTRSSARAGHVRAS